MELTLIGSTLLVAGGVFGLRLFITELRRRTRVARAQGAIVVILSKE